MKKYKIVVPLKVEQILQLLKGNRLNFNNEVIIIPEIDGKEESFKMIQKLSSMNTMGFDIQKELEEKLGLIDKEIKIFNEQRIIE